MKKLRRRPVRLDRGIPPGSVEFELVIRGFRKSIRMARKIRGPVRPPRA